MRHRVAGRKLGRTTEHRLALLRNLSTQLFEREKVKTTLAKAKELRPFAERLVTLSKRESLHARRQVLRHIKNPAVVSKLFDTISARFAERPGGYTRILRLGPRRGDHAEMAIIELVEAEVVAAPEPKPTKARKATKPSRRKKAAAEPAEEPPAAEPKKKKKRRWLTRKKKTTTRKTTETAEAEAPTRRKTTKKKAKKKATKKTAKSSKTRKSR